MCNDFSLMPGGEIGQLLCACAFYLASSLPAGYAGGTLQFLVGGHYPLLYRFIWYALLISTTARPGTVTTRISVQR